MTLEMRPHIRETTNLPRKYREIAIYDYYASLRLRGKLNRSERTNDVKVFSCIVSTSACCSFFRSITYYTSVLIVHELISLLPATPLLFDLYHNKSFSFELVTLLCKVVSHYVNAVSNIFKYVNCSLINILD